MFNSVRWKIGLGCIALVGGLLALIVGITSCGSAPTAFLVRGPGGLGNEVPTLKITVPDQDLTVPQGVPFLIKWNDTDRDDNAKISFELVDTSTNNVIILVEGINENDQSGPDSFTAGTALIPVGTYNLLGIIDDGVNPPVNSYAIVVNATTQRVLFRVVGAGEGPPSLPPTVAVVEPLFDLSVTQDDTVRIVVQPTQVAGAVVPFDGDSTVTLFLLLDTDLDPNNDDPFNPTPGQIIILKQQPVDQDVATLDPFNITIDLNLIPARPNGEPYFIRATVTDGVNKPVHSYAPGTISVVELASETVDLFDIGRRVSGAKFIGFNPSANLGSLVRGLTDFDADGIDDFVMVAQFGNPQNAGPVGEAYLLYGKDRIRYGGTISANSIGQAFVPGSQTLSGAIFQAPPVRSCIGQELEAAFAGLPVRCVAYPTLARTDGITDFDIIRDISGDGRPELLVGLPHVHGAYDSTDFDPADESNPDTGADFCYDDGIVNDFTDAAQPARFGISDMGFYAGGMAVVVNSQNRDNSGLINVNRLESTVVSLELVGQFVQFALDNSGFSETGSGNIFARADNRGQVGDADEPGRIAGGRLIGGFYDWVHNGELPREDLFGMNVSSISDLNSDGLDEIIVSSPLNERFVADLTNSGFESPQLNSTFYKGSLTVFPGRNFNDPAFRAIDDETGTSVTPFLDQHRLPPFGACFDPATPNSFQSRHFFLLSGPFDIFAEDIDDFLGGGKSAGDFNQDGIGDILCSAPLNDRSSIVRDTGAVYIIYGRTIFGGIELRLANDPVLRSPMLRVRGVRPGDQMGLKTAAGLDVNGDRFDDVIISSARTDFGGVTRSQCIGDFNGDGLGNTSDLSLASFSDCQVRFGASVFTSDPCKAFDYDNDSDIDAEDRCVFCCLSGACSVDSTCINGQDSGSCCANMVDNGFVAVVFGGRTIDGDRELSQIATSDLPGVVFYGGHANDLAGWNVSSAGDFNQDGFGDLLITAPGETRLDSAGRERLGVVYLIFGGTHLYNTQWNLSNPERGVGSSALPGIVFFSPFVKGRPNEAAPTTVGFIGDVNNDGFGDIAIGNPRSDFIDLTFPQGPNAPGDDPSAGRRSDAGEVYIVYGNNFGPNRATP